jgi:NitT/TauT family transport system substrate-binding protein
LTLNLMKTKIEVVFPGKESTMKIRIGHLSTFYHTAVLLMIRSDSAERIGAEIDWRLMGTGPAIMQAFGRGELDLAYIGLPPAIIGIGQGVPVICVAGGHMEGTVLAGKAGWKGFPELGELTAVLSQFRGEKIGVPGKGSIHDVILKHYVEKYGLESEIQIVNYAWADLVTEAVVKDDVSAAVGTPALAAAIKRFAGGRILYPPSRLWPANPSYGIVVHRDFLARKPEIVERFLRVHEEVAEFIRSRPRESAGLIADFVGVVDPEFVLDTLMVSPKYCAKLSENYIESTLKFLPVLKRLGYIKTEVAAERIFCRDLIEKVHPWKDHYGEGIATSNAERGMRSAK